MLSTGCPTKEELEKIEFDLKDDESDSIKE
jgi:hypothetical protein